MLTQSVEITVGELLLNSCQRLDFKHDLAAGLFNILELFHIPINFEPFKSTPSELKSWMTIVALISPPVL